MRGGAIFLEIYWDRIGICRMMFVLVYFVFWTYGLDDWEMLLLQSVNMRGSALVCVDDAMVMGDGWRWRQGSMARTLPFTRIQSEVRNAR